MGKVGDYSVPSVWSEHITRIIIRSTLSRNRFLPKKNCLRRHASKRPGGGHLISRPPQPLHLMSDCFTLCKSLNIIQKQDLVNITHHSYLLFDSLVAANQQLIKPVTICPVCKISRQSACRPGLELGSTVARPLAAVAWLQRSTYPPAFGVDLLHRQAQ